MENIQYNSERIVRKKNTIAYGNPNAIGGGSPHNPVFGNDNRVRRSEGYKIENEPGTKGIFYKNQSQFEQKFDTNKQRYSLQQGGGLGNQQHPLSMQTPVGLSNSVPPMNKVHGADKNNGMSKFQKSM